MQVLKEWIAKLTFKPKGFYHIITLGSLVDETRQDKYIKSPLMKSPDCRSSYGPVLYLRKRFCWRLAGRDASAPDSQKTGLCPEHDTIPNRALAFRAWQDLLNHEIGVQLDAVRQAGEAPLLKLAVQFMDGGKTVIPCRSFGITGGNTLEIVDADGQRKFYPLQHVRSYKTLADQN